VTARPVSITFDRTVVRLRANDFLFQLRTLEKKIENKMEEREQFRAMALSTTAAGAPDTGVRVQSSGSKQQMANAIDRCIDIDREIDAYIDELIEKKRDVTRVIEQLDSIEYDVLHKMYVGVVDKSRPDKRTKYLTLNEIADIYDRSYNWAKAKRGQARKNVQRILDAGEMSTN